MISPSRIMLLIAMITAVAASDAPPRELPPIVYGTSGHDDPLTLAGKGVWLPYERFHEWWDKSNPTLTAPSQPPLSAALTEASLIGEIEGARAHFTMKLSAVAVADGWSVVQLPGGVPLIHLSCSDPRVVVQRAKVLTVEVRPEEKSLADLQHIDGVQWKDVASANPDLDLKTLHTGDHIHLPLVSESVLIHLPAPGTYALDGEVAVAVVGDEGSTRSLALILPDAGAIRTELTIPGAELQVQMTSSGAWSMNRIGQATHVSIAPRGGYLGLQWQPMVAATGDAVLTANSNFAVHLSPRTIRYDMLSQLVIARRPLERIRMSLPAGMQPLSVEGAGVSRWENSDGGLDIILDHPVQGTIEVTVHLERLFDQDATGTIQLDWPHISGVSRTTGSVSIFAQDGAHASITAAPGLARVDPADLGADQAIAAFNYNTQPPASTIEMTILAPELRVQSGTLVRLGAEETTVAAHFHIDVRQAGTFLLTVQVPDGWDLLDTTGVTVDEIRPLPPVAGLRNFELQLRSRMSGENDVLCRFRAPPALTAAGVFALAPPCIVGTRSARGVVAVAAPRSWALSVAQRDGMTGIDAAEAGHQPFMTALVHDLGRDDELALAFTWQNIASVTPHARITTSARPRELTGIIEDHITIKDGQIDRALNVRGEVRYNPLSALTLLLPSAWDDLVVMRAAGLAERVKWASDVQGMTSWELRFQPPLIGAFQLQLEVAAPGQRLEPGKPVTLTVAPILLQGAGKLSYLTAIGRDGAIDLATSAPGMEVVAPADLPVGLSQGAVAGFQGSQAVPIQITATRQDLLDTAQAGIARSSWLAVVGEDGLVRLRGRLAVVSRGRSQIALVLPKSASLVEVTVDAHAARASRREDGAVVLPLPADGGEHRIAVVIEEKSTDEVPTWAGVISVGLPHIATTAGIPTVPVARTDIELWLPRHWLVSSWSGDLGQESGLASDENGDDGLSVPVTPAGHALYAARVGDGGRLYLKVVHDRTQMALALLFGLCTLGLAWTLRRQPVASIVFLCLLLAVYALAIDVWSLIAMAGVAGGVLGMLVSLGNAMLRARVQQRIGRLAAANAVDPDPWIEGGGPAT